MASSSSKQQIWCDHIVENIDAIALHLRGVTPADADRTQRDAVERCLARIAEAIARLHPADVDLDAVEPGIDWRGYRGFGNILRHEYDQVDEDEVSGMLVRELPALRPAALRLKAALAADAAADGQEPL